MAIDTPRELQAHLQSAIEVELSTIPPYLYAMYSIEDTASKPYKLIRSVVVEEMLHLALAANVLTAVGVCPQFYDEDVVPSYPMPLPHREPDLVLNLERCTTDVAGRVFATIERPKTIPETPENDEYESVGQFYRTIERAIDELSDRYPLFETCQVESQMTKPSYYGPVEYDVEESGGLHPVEDVDTAKRAIDTVIHQGEGLHDEQYVDRDRKEMTHYYKFKQIADGNVALGETRPVLKNPTTADLPTALRPVSELFNACYSHVFRILEDIYSPVDSETKDHLVGDLYALMTDVLRPLARFLTRHPANGQKRAGPTFEFYRFGSTVEPTEQLLDMCESVVGNYSELDRVHRALERVAARPREDA